MNFTVDEKLSFELSLSNVLEYIGEIFEFSTFICKHEENFPVTEYFAIFYAICIIASRKSEYKPSFSGSRFFTFDYDNSSNASKTTFKKGIEGGCQAFIISNDVFANFLSDFHEVHDDCIQVFPNKHVVVYQSGIDRNSSELTENLNHSSSIDGSLIFIIIDFTLNLNLFHPDLPNILFIDYHDEPKSFNVKTTKFSGTKYESSTLQVLTTININDDPKVNLADINLYPDKVLNLQGMEVVLALFNYMPYVLWSEVVSNLR